MLSEKQIHALKKLGKWILIFILFVVASLIARFIGAELGRQAAEQDLKDNAPSSVARKALPNQSASLREELLFLARSNEVPKMHSRLLRLDEVRVVNDSEIIFYISTPDRSIREFDTKMISAELVKEVRSVVCSTATPSYRLVRMGALFTYVYTDKDSIEFSNITVKAKDCL